MIGGTSEERVDLFYSSPIIYKENQIILSTSLSTFSMDSKLGNVKWEFPFATKINPIVINENIFLVSKKGFLINLDRKNGKVIWSRNLFKNLKKLNHQKTGDITSVLFVSDQLFITTKKGYFLFAGYQNGEIINYTKVSKGFFSKPVVANENIFIIDKKMRVLQFN